METSSTNSKLIKNMNSPITGNPMRLVCEKRIIPFRKEDFEVDFHYWLCEDTKQRFEDEQQAEANINQVYNQYRAKYNVLTIPEGNLCL
jgi:hypothetical protein